MRLTFPKAERLSSKKNIDQLFKFGAKIRAGSFTLFGSPKDNSNPRIEILISVPKKNITKAVRRTHIKRVIRECYRKNKEYIYSLFSNEIYIALIYNHSEIIEYVHLEAELLNAFNLLRKKINENS